MKYTFKKNGDKYKLVKKEKKESKETPPEKKMLDIMAERAKKEGC